MAKMQLHSILMNLCCIPWNVGAKLNDAGQIIYLVKLKDSYSFEENESQRVKQIWPHLLVDFLQSRVRWTSLTHALPSGHQIVEAENPTGSAICVKCKWIGAFIVSLFYNFINFSRCDGYKRWNQIFGRIPKSRTQVLHCQNG